jgi:hypothetical protein
MTCSHCQAELPDSATTCHQCGTATQQGQPTTFSYLPAGTPPWPTTVPARLPYGLESPSVAPVASATTSQTGKPRRSARSVLLAIAVLVLIPILGSAFTLTNLYLNGDLFPSHAKAKATTSQVRPTPATQQTPGTAQQANQLPVPTSFSKSSDKDLNLSLQYPSDWQEGPMDKSGGTVTTGFHPAQQLGIVFVVERIIDSSQVQSADALNQVIISSAGSQLGATKAQPVSSAETQPTISGTKWTEMDVILSNAQGGENYFASISVLHNKSYYNLAFVLPTTAHDEAMQKYIQPMLDSVQFLS